MNGAFGGVQVGYGGNGFDKPKRIAAGADFGFAIPIGSSKATFCPQFQTIYQLSERSFGTQQQLLTTSAGFSIGRAFTFSRSFSLVPFVQGGLLHRYNSIAVRDPYSGYPNYDQSKLGGQVGAGFGLRFGDVLTLRTALTVPLGFPKGISGESEPIYSITASFGFRR